MGLRSQVTCLSREVPRHENNLEGSVLRAIAIAALSQLKYIVIEKKKDSHSLEAKCESTHSSSSDSTT